MKDTDYLDDLTLNAFVDGELDAGSRANIIRSMETDAGLCDRIYRLRRTKDLMQLAFGDAAPAPSRSRPRQNHWRLFPVRLIASAAVLAVSFGAGMLGQRHLDSLSVNGGSRMAGQSQQQPQKIILHVSQYDRGQFTRVLDYTERFLRQHEASGSAIEVVAHARGLDLLRDDVSPLRERILALIRLYNNVHFFACADSINMLQEKGVEPVIIQGISTDVPVFEHIIERLQAGGWKYIRADALPRV